jgi:hypothetical protein
MPRGVKKENLPSKVCVTCNRPFTWRKKWERCWDEVTTCSKSCNRKRRESTRPPGVDASGIQALQPASSDSEQEDAKTKRLLVERDNDHDEPTNFLGNREAFSIPEDDSNDNLDFDITAILDLSMLVNQLDEIEPADDASTSSSITEDGGVVVDTDEDPVAQRKAERKAAKKAKKAERRAQREGRGDPSAGQKSCDMCNKSVDLLIRCTYDESLQWNMVCGKCWNNASGGIVDGGSSHPYYRYGGLWKNRRAQK